MQSQSAREPLTDWKGCAFLDALSSPPVTFLVGETLEPVVVPAAFMLDLSPRFAFRMKASMGEGQENRIALPSIEKEFFLRLVEFAYHRDYTVSRFLNDPQVWGDGEPVQDSEREDESDDSDYEVDEEDAMMEGDTEDESDGIDYEFDEGDAVMEEGDTEDESDDTESDDTEYEIDERDTAMEEGDIASELAADAEIPMDQLLMDRTGYRSDIAYKRFVEKTFATPSQQAVRHDFIGDYELHQVGHSGQPLNKLFLLHAQMYHLAEYFMIPALKDLALYKLHEALKRCLSIKFFQAADRVRDFFDLAVYAYTREDTHAGDGRVRLDALRQEVLDYAFAHIGKFTLTPVFHQLLLEQPQLSTDLFFLISGSPRADFEHIINAPENYFGEELVRAFRLIASAFGVE